MPDLSLDFIRKYTRRKKNHDYRSPCHYHIILRKALQCPDYGTVVGSPLIPYPQSGCADILHTKLGKIIGSHIFNLPHRFSNVGVYQYKVMPNHVHIFFRVKKRSDTHLGKYISILKSDIAEEFSQYCKVQIKHNQIFEENYTDKIVYLGRDFNVIINYIRENPHRLAMQLQFPEFFQRKDFIEYEGISYEGYGNHFLLKNPFKLMLRLHRNCTDMEFEEIKDKALEHLVEGGVLVSPFINPLEKKIRDLGQLMGGKIIKIQKDAFTDKYKPYKSNFNYSATGHQLIIAPKITLGDSMNREIALRLNRLAEKICEA